MRRILLAAFAFFLLASPLVSAAEPPLKICLLSASGEYKSDESLTALKEHLEKNHNAKCTLVKGKDKGTDFDSLDALDDCDVLVLFSRRIVLSDGQLAKIKKYCDAGRPLVGIRTASHAIQNWLELDKLVLGGDYQGHYGAGPKTKVSLTDKGREHPVLRGVEPFVSVGSLYKNPKLAADVQVLMTGAIPDHTEPLTWTREHRGGRVFYTSLGHPDDFAIESYRRMIVNAIFWTAKRDVPKGKE